MPQGRPEDYIIGGVLPSQRQVDLTKMVQEAERLRAANGGSGANFTQPQRAGLEDIPRSAPVTAAAPPVSIAGGRPTMMGGMPAGGPPLAGFELRQSQAMASTPEAPPKTGFWRGFQQGFSSSYRDLEAQIQQRQAITRLQQGQAQLQAFEIQEKMRDQKAMQNVPTFQKVKLKPLKSLTAEIIKNKQGIDPTYEGSFADVQAAMLASNAGNGVQYTPLDMDTMFRTEQGRMMMLEMGVMPLESRVKMIQEQVGLNQKFQDEQRRSITLKTLGDINEMTGKFTPNKMGEQIAQQFNIDPNNLARQLTQKDGPLPPDVKIHPSQFALRQGMTSAMQDTPGQQAAAQQAFQKHLFDLDKEREKSRLDTVEQERKAAQKIAQIDHQAERDKEKIATQFDRRTKLQSVQTADKKTLMSFGSDLKKSEQAEAIRLNGLEKIRQIRLKAEVNPGALTFEQRKALMELEQGAKDGQLDKALLAKELGQLKGLSQKDRQAVLNGLLRSGAVSPDVLMEATKRLDGKDGSMSKTLLSAIQEVQAEISTDPITDSINRYRLAAKNSNDAMLDLASYRDHLKAMNKKHPSPDLEEGIQRTQAAIDEIREMKQTGGATEKGNSLFESSSQAVKDILLSRPGDLMHNATYKDVKDAIQESQQNKIEVALGRAQGLKDQENIRSAGEIFGIIDKFRALGQELFTDNSFLRLSGVQGSGKIAQSYIKTNPRLQEYLRLREGLSGHLSRIGGERGIMTEGDINRAKSFVPDPTDFFPESLTTFNNMMGSFEEFVSNKVRGRYDQRALDLLQGGSTSERKLVSEVEDVLAEAKRRTGITE